MRLHRLLLLASALNGLFIPALPVSSQTWTQTATPVRHSTPCEKVEMTSFSASSPRSAKTSASSARLLYRRPVWMMVADNLPGTGATLQVTDLGGARQPQRFYRARVLP